MKWKKMNKKGQTDLIGNVLKLIPKPIIFLIFILLITVIVSLLNPVFNSFGVFCKTNEEVVKVHDASFFDNLKLISSLPSFDEIAGSDIDPNKFVLKCTESVNGTQRLINYGCSSCSHIVDYVSKIDSTSKGVCLGDAFRTGNNNLSWWSKRVACPVDDCRIPNNYYYEVDSGNFECFDLQACTSTKLSATRDAKLDELGAVPLYFEGEDASFEGFFRFGCTNKLRVEPTVKGVPIFSASFWAIILLIIILLWAIMKFGVHKNNK